MRKSKLLQTIFFLAISASSFAQNEYDPSILILPPQDFQFDEALANELDSIKTIVEDEFKLILSENPETDLSGPENQRRYVESGINLIKEVRYENEIPLILMNFWSYKFFEVFPNYLLVSDTVYSSSNIESLQNLARKHRVRYIVSLPDVRFQSEPLGKHSLVRALLFDAQTNELVIDKSYKGDHTNPGFEWACQPGSINCTINNALSSITDEFLYIIASESPYLRNKNMIDNQRRHILGEMIENQTGEKITDRIVTNNKPALVNGNHFFEVLDTDSTKFIAFYIERNRAKNFDDLSSIYTRQINIKMEGPERGWDISMLPNTYAQLVAGLKFENKWYLELKDATVFPSGDLNDAGKWYVSHILLDNNFFNESSTDVSDLFWESGHFSKVSDITKTPEFSSYPEIYETQAREDAPYIGMYEMVANQLKKEHQEYADSLNKNMINTVFKPFLTSLIDDKTNDFKDFPQLTNDRLHVIFPSDESVFLLPITHKTVSGNGSEINELFYFVYFEGEYYQWFYFDQNTSSTPILGSYIVDQMGGITKWNYGYETLDDDLFWNEYVLPKKGSQFLYLKKM